MDSKKYFDVVAHKWEEMRAGFYSPSVRNAAFSAARVEKGKTAADIGAGTGFITEGLVRRGIKVIAVDQSQSMLEELRKRIVNVGEVDCRVGEAEKLPLSDGSVDYAFANMYLHHVESPPKAIKEMVRILKPAGKLVITDMEEHNFEFLRIEHHDRWMGFKRDNVRRWFKEAGLKNVKVDCAGECCCAQSQKCDDYARVSIFIATGEKNN